MEGDAVLEKVLSFADLETCPRQAGEESESQVNSTSWEKSFHYAYWLVHDRAEAEDITQEAFIELLKEQQAGRTVQRLASWMSTVIRRIAYRRYHKYRPDLHLSLDVATAADNDSEGYGCELVDTAPTPEQHASYQNMMRLAEQVICEFPARDRACILLYANGNDFRSIATELGVSRWTARRVTLKAFQKFQARMAFLRQ